MACPADRVFRVPELLETVLGSLSQRDLLLSQRVSTAFRDTIRSSLTLRRRLFLNPDWKLETCRSDAGRRPENNRLLLRAFPGCYPTITLVTTEKIARGPDDSGYESSSSSENTKDGRQSSGSWSWDCCISFPADALPPCHPSVLYPEASWRRMYLSQPPCQALFLVRRWQRSKRCAIIRNDGITMGDLVDETSKSQPSWHSSYVSSDRDWHFEGNIQCTGVEDYHGDFHYAFCRSYGGHVIRTFSDEWLWDL